MSTSPRFRRVEYGLILTFNALCIFFGGYVLLGWYCMEGMPISQSNLDRLEVGMTMKEVEDLVGSPSNKVSGGSWTYSSSFLWTMIYIEFDDSGRFQETIVDR